MHKTANLFFEKNISKTVKFNKGLILLPILYLKDELVVNITKICDL